jgi:hypothetical protein
MLTQSGYLTVFVTRDFIVFACPAPLVTPSDSISFSFVFVLGTVLN